jgi:nitrous oxide reductase accessory protein NosL
MKKFAPILIIFVIVALIVGLFLSLGNAQKMVVIKEGNVKKVPLKMEPNKCQDSFCGMVISDLTYASQVVGPHGKTWFFHDHGDFVEWLKDKPFEKDAVIWVMSRDTHRWIDGRKAFYSINELTPMGYGFGAYEKKAPGMIDFETMRLKTLRGETMKDPKIRKQILGK